MREPGSELYLEQEALGADLRGDFGAQHLERDFAVVAEVVREEHDSHSPLAKLASDRVTAGEGGFQTCLQCGHRRQDAAILAEAAGRAATMRRRARVGVARSVQVLLPQMVAASRLGSGFDGRVRQTVRRGCGD